MQDAVRVRGTGTVQVSHEEGRLVTPLLLDLFCCQGGAAKGYADAGFDVIGVDLHEQPRYPYPMRVADALDLLRTILDGKGFAVYQNGMKRVVWGSDIAAIHASPPCQALSTITPDKSKHVNLIPEVRELLDQTGLPYVIENVEGARPHMLKPVRLCGSAFGMQVRRHRLFESNVPLMSTPCDHKSQGPVYGVYGSHGDNSHTYLRPDGTGRGRRASNVEHARELMGMPWADWHGCTQAIPPAYTEHIGGQLLAHIQERRAA